jgi:uncharacterized protein YdeI (YjbR/CyaY-like superfamily)
MKDYALRPFATQGAWRAWLDKNHAKADGIWIKFYKKHTGKKTVNYAQALDEALCYGWIDGQSKSIDEDTYKQKFTPRRASSIWSKRNTGHVARLIKLKKMTAAGLAQVNAAKKDGRWAAAYGAQSAMEIPDDFLQRLAKNKKAEKFFKTLNRSHLFAVSFQLHHAKKPETRERRMKQFIRMFSKGESFHFYKKKDGE